MTEKPRVLLVHNMIAPYRLPFFQELDKKVDLTVYFCYRKSKDRRWYTDLCMYEFKKEVLPHIKLGLLILNFTLFFRLFSSKFDVYIVCENAYETMLSGLTVLIFSRFFKKPIVVWSEHINTEYSQTKRSLIRQIGEFILRTYRKILYSNTNAFMAFSKKAKEFLMLNDVPEGKIFCGWQTVPTEQLAAANISKCDTPYKDKLIVLAVCYLLEHKGIDYLIKAFNRLSIQNAILIIVGAGKDEERLKDMAKSNPNIHCVGYVDGVEKSNYYAIADVFVMPTLYDAWGLVINEAMFFGLPIITTTAAGSSEIINDNGLLVPPADVQALQKAIERLLLDEDLRLQMGLKSREYMDIYTVSKSAKPLANAINFVLGR